MAVGALPEGTFRCALTANSPSHPFIMEKSTLKKLLHEKCEEYIAKRIATAQNAMDEAQRAANEETKSSAGDKFETGRAMMHLEKQKNAFQLGEALKVQQQLSKVNPNKSYPYLAQMAMLPQ